MRLTLLLILALAVTVLLALFPEIARQTLHIQAFGWVFETHQGAFVVALLVILFVAGLLRALIAALLAGPGQIWATLRMGGRKRREVRLREAIAQWLDMRGDLGARTLRRSRGIVPEWTLSMLNVLSVPSKDQALPEADADPLVTALAARVATDPAAHPKPDIATRKAHLEAWLAASPGAPLAVMRLADLAEEEEDWSKAIHALERIQQLGFRSSHSIRPRLATAYARLAAEKPDQALSNLRKAARLAPENEAIALALGNTLLKQGQDREAVKLWWEYLENYDSFAIARHLLLQIRSQAMQEYRRLEKRDTGKLNPALRWLTAELANAAKLEGIAREQMQALADAHHCPEALQSLGDWLSKSGDSARAAEYYRQAAEQLTRRLDKPAAVV
ncbi:MAG TPA: tetratricopeptide repeat protein [Mariprofundaceae bacterium]|nr:tetratricopeptide repeat protein [Mariprofundaceae bacterium]